MDYNKLIKRVAEESGKPKADIMAILDVIPEVLKELEVGEVVKTPLGKFTKKRRQPKRVKTLQGPWTNSRGKIVVTLTPGKNLIDDLAT